MLDKVIGQLSCAQEQLWFQQQVNLSSSVYNIATVCDITGTLDIVKLKSSFRYLIERHDSLRVNIRVKNGVPYQVINSSSDEVKNFFYEQSILLNDKSGLEKKIIEFVNKPFLLETESLIRALLIKKSKNSLTLIVVVHHIICDGWSLNVFFSELRQCYEAYVTNTIANFEPIKTCYFEYANEQREKLTTNFFNDDRDYWHKTLQGATKQLDLYTDYQRPSVGISSGSKLYYKVEDAITTSIYDFAKSNKASPFLICLSALYGFLYRYSGQEDIIIGVPFLNRSDSNTHSTMGLFVNTLPIRVTINNRASLLELVNQVKSTLGQAMGYQNYPLSEIIKHADCDRSLARSPLFQIMAVQTVETENMTFGDAACETLAVDTKTSMYEMSFYIRISRQSLSLVVEYSDELYIEKTIRNFIACWESVVKQIVTQPNTLVKDTVMLANDVLPSRISTLKSFESSKAACELTLVDMFYSQLMKTPNKIALKDGVRTISYKELNVLSNSIQHLLEKERIQSSSIVAICLDRSIERVAAIIAVLKMDATFLPLETDITPYRMSHILKEAKVAALITLKQYAYNYVNSEINPLYIDEAQDGGECKLVNEVTSIKYTNKIAYLIFTSGSSGRPKLVRGTHAGLINRIVWSYEIYPFLEEEVCCHQASVMFVDSIAEMFVPLLNGIPSIIVAKNNLLDLTDLIKLIKTNNISRILLIPSLLRLFLEICEKVDAVLSSLKLIMVSGEVLDVSLMNKFFKIFPGKKLINIYGSSEVSADASYFELSSISHYSDIPIGQPIKNTEIFILDKNRKIVPRGVVGEIYISGRGVAAGYLGNDKATREKFLQNPYSKQSDSMKMYATSDYGYLSTSGLLHYRGRLDNVVKVRGKRVELSDIESNLLNHQAVKEVIVSFDVKKQSHQLRAYFVKSNKNDILFSKDIQNFLRQYIPEYMIPSQYYEVTELPKTATGKLDRKNLSNIDANLLPVEQKYDISESQLQKKIKAIWLDVLNIDNISLHDNFFDSGGHSLLLMQLKRKLKNQLNYDVSIMDLFEHPTIMLLSQHMASDKEKNKELDSNRHSLNIQQEDIAIIGMAVRVPDANNQVEFWNNLMSQHCAIKEIQPLYNEETNTNVSDSQQTKFVYSAAQLKNVEYFAANFFGMSPQEAAVLDPQQRVFMENVWEALENAAIDPMTYEGKIGLYAGTSTSTYFLANILPTIDFSNPANVFSAITSNSENYLATRIAYKLNLQGPCATVQTACSTSLVAVHMACRSLQVGDADIMLAGGVTIKLPQDNGYIYQQGLMVSPTGKCRAFERDSDGTVFSNGSGVVVLKRLSQAIDEGDFIHAVIKGSAVNNDGNSKVGYVAPSLSGQIKVIKEALNNASVKAETIGFIESHGTGTSLGDKIELSALKKVFMSNQHKRSVAVGAVKENIGHLDAAAGVISLCKASMVLRYGCIPGSAAYKHGNDELSADGKRFYIPTENISWKQASSPRRAGVSSFGIGGTNAHVILEEAPILLDDHQSSGPAVVNLSAKTPSELKDMHDNLREYLVSEKNLTLNSIAYTLNIGRQAFGYRWSCVASTTEQLLDLMGKEFSCEKANERTVLLYVPQNTSVSDHAEFSLTNCIYQQSVDNTYHTIREQLESANNKKLLLQLDEAVEKSNINNPIFNFVLIYSLCMAWINIINVPIRIACENNDDIRKCIYNEVSFEKALAGVVLADNKKQATTHHAMQKTDDLHDNEIVVELGHLLKLRLSADRFEELLETQGNSNSGFYQCISSLWNLGVTINWQQLYRLTKPKKAQLPTYPFEKQKYWIEPTLKSFDVKDVKLSAANNQDANLRERPGMAIDYQPPNSTLEINLEKIWGSILGIKNLGINDDFFDLGGDSLLAQQIISEINMTYPLDVSLSTFFNKSTISSLGQHIYEQLMQVVDELSEEQVEQLLRE